MNRVDEIEKRMKLAESNMAQMGRYNGQDASWDDVRYLLSKLKDGGAEHDALLARLDREWIAGARFGWNCGIEEPRPDLGQRSTSDRDSGGYARLRAAINGRLRDIAEAKHDAAAPTESAERCGECLRCKHTGNLDGRGICQEAIWPFHASDICQCKCVFPATEQAGEQRSNRDPHPFQEHPLYPDYCAYAVGDEDYCKREQLNEIHLSDDIDQHGRRIPFTAPAPSVAQPEVDDRCKCGLDKDDPIHSFSTEWQAMHLYEPRTTSPSTAAQDAAKELDRLALLHDSDGRRALNDKELAPVVAVISRYCKPQSYPTADAYEAACAALNKSKAEVSRLNSEVERLKSWGLDCVNKIADVELPLRSKIESLRASLTTARADAIAECVEAVKEVQNGPVSRAGSQAQIYEWGRGVHAALAALEQLKGEGGRDAN